MQPYFFPYYGYFDLISAVDVFVFFDDVQYIKSGWINRNRVTQNNKQIYFTVPVKKSPQKTPINQMKIFGTNWVQEHLKTFNHCYGNRIANHKLFQMYSDLGRFENLSDMVCHTIIWMCKHLGIRTKFEFSHNLTSDLCKEQRIIQICKSLGATSYFNLPGGKHLYHPDEFQSNGIDLNFIDTSQRPRTSILEICFHENNANCI